MCLRYRVPARRVFKCSRHHKLSSPLVVNDWRLHTRGWGTTCRLAAFPPTLLFFSEYFLPSYHSLYSQQTNMEVIIAQSLFSFCLGLTSSTHRTLCPLLCWPLNWQPNDPDSDMLWICPLTRNLGHALYSQFRMSDMKTARPRIPSPRTGAIVRAGGGAAVGLGQPLSGFRFIDRCSPYTSCKLVGSVKEVMRVVIRYRFGVTRGQDEHRRMNTMSAHINLSPSIKTVFLSILFIWFRISWVAIWRDKWTLL